MYTSGTTLCSSNSLLIVACTQNSLVSDIQQLREVIYQVRIMVREEKERRELTLLELLKEVGEFLLYQRIVLLVAFLMLIPANYQIFLMYFSTITPSWKCSNPTISNFGNKTNNQSRCTFGNILPNSDYRRCSIPRNEWQYTESNDFSLVTRFAIDCEKEWLLHLLNSMVFVGFIIGSVALGWIADKKGRKYVIYPSLVAILTLGLASSFSTKISLIVICRGLIGFGFPGVYIQGILLVNELIGGKYRAIAGLTLLCTMPVACCILTLKAYLTKSWRMLSIICSAPYFVLLFSYPLLPESLPWLMARDKTDDVSKIARKIGSWNGQKLPDQFLLVRRSDQSEVGKTNILDVIGGYKNCLKLLKLAALWASICLGFYGVTIAADDLGGTIYRDFLIISVIELPVRVISGPACNRFGRKKSVLVPLLCCGIALTAVAFIPTDMKTARLAIGIIGKLSITIVAGTIYTWSLELYPVSVRSRMLGVFQVFGRVGAASAPWVTKGLKHFGAGYGFIVMAVMALVACGMGTQLPDTNAAVDADHLDKESIEQGKRESEKEKEAIGVLVGVKDEEVIELISDETVPV